MNTDFIVEIQETTPLRAPQQAKIDYFSTLPQELLDKISHDLPLDDPAQKFILNITGDESKMPYFFARLDQEKADPIEFFKKTNHQIFQDLYAKINNAKSNPEKLNQLFDATFGPIPTDPVTLDKKNLLKLTYVSKILETTKIRETLSLSRSWQERVREKFLTDKNTAWATIMLPVVSLFLCLTTYVPGRVSCDNLVYSCMDICQPNACSEDQYNFCEAEIYSTYDCGTRRQLVASSPIIAGCSLVILLNVATKILSRYIKNKKQDAQNLENLQTKYDNFLKPVITPAPGP